MIATHKDPIRILHVVGGMNYGGVETWLMNLLRQIDRDRFHIDFLVHTAQPCPYDDEIRKLGSQVIPCLSPSQPLQYARNFRRILHSRAPYHVIHSHVHHYSGYILFLAQKLNIPVRIAHSHNDTSMAQLHAGYWRRSYLKLMSYWIDQHATIGLAASHKAAVALFGSDYENDQRWQILYCGVDLRCFQEHVDAHTVRAEFNIPSDAFVLGHVGRFTEQKNHSFLLELVAEVVRRNPKTYLILLGEGPLRTLIEQKVHQLGLSKHVIFAGIRSDIPRIMLGAMDIFILPSLYEGLPLVGIEAQAAGVPLLISDVITDELDYVKPLVKRMSLTQPASTWAEAALEICQSPILDIDHRSLLEQSRFNIINGLKALEKIYAYQ